LFEIGLFPGKRSAVDENSSVFRGQGAVHTDRPRPDLATSFHNRPVDRRTRGAIG